MQPKFVVDVPVTDLRREQVRGEQNLKRDPLQESQLLFGEHVNLLDVEGKWAWIEAIEQEKYYPKTQNWGGYRGWVQIGDLMAVERFPTQNYVVTKHDGEYSFGTRLIGEETPAGSVVDLGRSMLGFPYFWGGRSSYRPNMRSSVDCSGFVNLLYRAKGVNLPRDAHDQYLRCEKIDGVDLKMGDLVFSAEEERMTHVMLYSGEGKILEATEESGNVREISAKEKFEVSLASVQRGERFNGKTLYFGRIS